MYKNNHTIINTDLITTNYTICKKIFYRSFRIKNTDYVRNWK